MKIAIIGATGKAGNLITEEALKRGHDVTAIVRNPEKLSSKAIETLKKDIFELTLSDLQDFDAVINAFGTAPGHEEEHLTSVQHLITVLQDQSSPRLLMVGGAASLFVDEAQTTRLFDTEGFPDLYKPIAGNMLKGFLELKASRVNWTYQSPAAHFDFEGPRTGRYTLGADHLILNSTGQSYISYADFAIAMIDELENKAFVQRRFTAVSNS